MFRASDWQKPWIKPSEAAPHDELKFQVFDASGKLLGTVVKFSNLDAASGYRQYSASLNALHRQIGHGEIHRKE